MDFIKVVLPIFVFILATAIFYIEYIKRMKTESYIVDGMCYGICLGVLANSCGVISLGLALSLGMLIGEIVGMKMKKA